MESSLVCKVCLRAYDTKEHCPLSLPCGHTACTTCLKTLAANNDDSGKVTCPFDKAESPISLTNLPKNFALIDVIDATAREQPPPKVAATQRRCSVHGDDLHLYDVDCEQLVCRDCLSLEHHGHKCMQIRETADTARTRLQMLAAQMDTDVATHPTMLACVNDALVTLEIDHQNGEKMIKDSFDEVGSFVHFFKILLLFISIIYLFLLQVRRRLDTREVTLRNMLHDAHKTNQFGLVARADHIRSMLDHVRHAREINVQCDRTDDMETIVALKEMEQHLSHVDKVKRDLINNILFVTIPSDEVLANIDGMGQVVFDLAAIHEDDDLIILLLNKLTDPAQLRQVCEHIYRSKNVNGSKDFGDAVISMMTSHPNDEELQSLACWLCAKAGWFAPAVIELVLTAMRTFPMNIVLQIRACKAVRHNPHKDNDSALEAMFDMVMKVMHTTSNETTLTDCCKALSVLAQVNFKFKFLEDVIDTIIKTIGMHTHVAALQLNGAEALMKLSLSDIGGEVFIRKNGIDISLTAMQTFKDNKDVLCIYCNLLYSLSFSARERILKAGALDMVWAAMTAFPLFENLQTRGKMLLSRIDEGYMREPTKELIRTAYKNFPKNSHFFKI